LERSEVLIKDPISYNIQDILTRPMPKMEWLIENIIRKSAHTYLYGHPGSFKTSFALYCALNASLGKDVFHFKVEKPLNILWIDEEMGAEGVQYLLHKISKGMGLNAESFKNVHFIVWTDNGLDIIETLPATLFVHLSEFERQKKPIDLIVFDSIAKGFAYDEKDKSFVRRIHSGLKPVRTKHKVAMLFIHHSRKGTYSSKGMNEISGSHEFAAQCDDLLCLDNVSTNRYRLVNQKARYHQGFEPINFDVTGDDVQMNITYSGLVTDNVIEKAKVKIIKWWTDNPSESYKTSEIKKKMYKEYKLSEYAVYNALVDMASVGMLKQDKDNGIFKWLSKGSTRTEPTPINSGEENHPEEVVF